MYQSQTPTFRVTLVIALVAMLLVMLTVRLVDIQMVRGASFRILADENRFFTRALMPDRGTILDRYGTPLTQNERRYIRFDQPFSLYQQGQAMAREEALPVMATEPGRVGFVSTRLYPFGQSVGAVVGHLGSATVAQIQNEPGLLPNQPVGKMGLEASFDRLLRGQPGKEILEINAMGMPQRTVTQQPAIAGQNVTTSLDATLSQIAYEALGEQRGTVIINDASTGAILALVTKPTFDPALFAQDGLSAEEQRQRALQLQAAFTDQRQLFFNRAISGSYPPGSIFKLVTALAGLETKALDPAKTVLDEGTLKVGEYEYRNWYFTQYGRTEGEINLRRALARSNDIYFYKAAEWIGPDNLAEVARQFGFGTKPNSGLGAEAAGLVPDPAWKEKTLNERWFLGNTYHFGIGQGDLLVSPLQVSQLVQAVARQGSLCTPHLAKDKAPDCHELGLQHEYLEVVLKGMLDACSPGGTAFPFFPYNESRRKDELSAEAELWQGAVACKTGTAEFGGIVDSQGHRRTHAWFVAIVEPGLHPSSLSATNTTQAPTATGSAEVTDTLPLQRLWQQKVVEHGFPQRITITVLVESDEQQLYKEGSREAAPVAKAILDWIVGATVDVSNVQ